MKRPTIGFGRNCWKTPGLPRTLYRTMNPLSLNGPGLPPRRATPRKLRQYGQVPRLAGMSARGIQVTARRGRPTPITDVSDPTPGTVGPSTAYRNTRTLVMTSRLRLETGSTPLISMVSFDTLMNGGTVSASVPATGTGRATRPVHFDPMYGNLYNAVPLRAPPRAGSLRDMATRATEMPTAAATTSKSSGTRSRGLTLGLGEVGAASP
jgi:hypothetical protein